MDMPLSGIRREYYRQALDESSAEADPIRFFDQWFDAVVKSGVIEPNAMTLATVGLDGRPAARVLLLKGYDAGGFVFYTNYDSRKGQELDANPLAAMCFWWPECERQVRVEGRVERTLGSESDAYFRSRPRTSQLGACASPQSREVASRAELEERLAALEYQYREAEVPRPENWGGYRLVPDRIEFWQGRDKRLHDRLLYRARPDGGWDRVRLAP